MKHSKIYLAFTTALLAIAGVAAAKAHFVGLVTAYYKNSADVCAFSVKYRVNDISLGGVLYTVAGRTVYTEPTCSIPAYYHNN